jgi:hypothetical protein
VAEEGGMFLLGEEAAILLNVMKVRIFLGLDTGKYYGTGN